MAVTQGMGTSNPGLVLTDTRIRQRKAVYYANHMNSRYA
jgi:hypothetical protein